VEIQETMQFIKELQQQQQDNALQIISALQQQPQNAKPLERTESANSSPNTAVESVPNEVRTTLTTANRVSEPQDTFLRADEKSLMPKEKRAIKPNVIKMVKQRRKLRNPYVSTYWDLRVLKSGRRVVESENFYFNLDIEEIDEKAKNVQTLLDKASQLEIERQNLRFSKWHFWNWQRKKELDAAIEQAEYDSKKALLYFGRTYHVNPDEIERIIVPIQKKIKANELKIADKDDQISKVEKKFANVKQEFDNYRLEHKIRVRREVKKPLEPSAELTTTSGRKSVRKHLQEIRKPEVEREKRAKARARREKIKPEKFLMVESGERRKLSLADVLGKYYRKSNGRVYPKVAFVKDKKTIE